MLLCDVGNTSFAFYKEGVVTKVYKENFDFNTIDEQVYYICVEPEISKKLNKLELWCNVEPHIELAGSYEGLGVDRKLAISYLDDGVVVDAGSAITIDLIEDKIYQGGFIYPGFKALASAYRQISSKLDFLLNFEVDLDKMAKNSQDAISYGSFRPIISEIKRLSEGKKLIITGGDGEFLAKHLTNALYEPNWLFKAMLKVIQTKGKPC
jgi:type III pantothenate kinase